MSDLFNSNSYIDAYVLNNGWKVSIIGFCSLLLTYNIGLYAAFPKVIMMYFPSSSIVYSVLLREVMIASPLKGKTVSAPALVL